jgi:hypothetical protein
MTILRNNRFRKVVGAVLLILTNRGENMVPPCGDLIQYILAGQKAESEHAQS